MDKKPFPFDHSDFSETIEKYLTRCKAEREGIAISELRRLIPRACAKSRAAMRRMGMKRVAISPHRESALDSLLESLSARRNLAEIDTAIALLLDCEPYKEPARARLSQTDVRSLFPIDEDTITDRLDTLFDKKLENLLDSDS